MTFYGQGIYLGVPIMANTQIYTHTDIYIYTYNFLNCCKLDYVEFHEIDDSWPYWSIKNYLIQPII